MKKYLKKIKKRIGRKLPSKMQSFIRKTIRLINKPVEEKIIPEDELKIFKSIKDSMHVVFDVGAREDLSFYKIKNNCSYHLFEPNTKAVASLKKQISLLDKPDITLNEFGLSDKNEDDCIYYEESESFIVNRTFKSDVDKGHRYSLRKLDDYVREKNIPKIDFLKIDAEGLDYKIIIGGLTTIKQSVSFIQFEFWDGSKKFEELLGDTFNLYLMMEPGLLNAIQEDAIDLMTPEQKQKDYTKSIIPLDNHVIDLIDKIFVPLEFNGNILGIRKDLNIDIKNIEFKIKSNK